MGPSFDEDVAFLKRHIEVIELSRGSASVAVVPAYQGRVMTSTSGGRGYGWINRAHIASGRIDPHINVYGGEDRFWLGPEGGQFAIFFKKGDPFDLEHWVTPAAIDTEPFEVTSQTSERVTFLKDMRIENYAGRVFDLRVDRSVTILEETSADRVAFQSENRITNTGDDAWEKKTGLLSIWILGMFNPSPETTVVIPLREGPGAAVNDAYFGKVPSDRLKVKPHALFFRGDGRTRGKIGVSPRRAKPVLGSYDGTLTIVEYTKPEGATEYVNSLWAMQEDPFGGDAVNSYNDGPPEPGKNPLGPFYELETSSPAAALAPGESLTHIHRTFHTQGSDAQLDPIARAVLGVEIAEIRSALPCPRR